VLGGEVQLHVARVALADPLRPQRLYRRPDQLRAGVAEQLLGERVHVDDPAVGGRGDDRVGQALEDRGGREQQLVERVVALAHPSLLETAIHAWGP
jgi:hypothetical protein